MLHVVLSPLRFFSNFYISPGEVRSVDKVNCFEEVQFPEIFWSDVAVALGSAGSIALCVTLSLLRFFWNFQVCREEANRNVHESLAQKCNARYDWSEKRPPHLTRKRGEIGERAIKFFPWRQLGSHFPVWPFTLQITFVPFRGLYLSLHQADISTVSRIVSTWPVQRGARDRGVRDPPRC